MLESIRKYQWLMVSVFILLAAAFLFTVNDFNSSRGSSGNETLISIYDRDYDRSDIQNVGGAGIQMAEQVGLYDMLRILGGGIYYGSYKVKEPNIQLFFQNRIILQKKAKEFGIYPSDEQVREELRTKVGAFLKQDGEFNSEAYSRYVATQLKRIGVNEQDGLFPLIADRIALRKLYEILGSDLSTPRPVAQGLYDLREQKITVERLSWNVSDFKKTLKPTEEELKAHWESTKENYPSLPQYRLSYVTAKPAYPTPTKTEEEDKAEAKDAKKPADTAKKDNPKDHPDYVARKAAEDEINQSFDLLWAELDNNKDGNFAAIAQSKGFTVQNTELFTKETAPAIFKAKMKDPQAGIVTALHYVSQLDTDENTFTDTIVTLDEDYMICHLDEIIPASPLPYEEAKARVRIDYIKVTAQKNMRAAADKAHTDITEALERGESFYSAIAKLKLKASGFGPFGQNDGSAGKFPQEPNIRDIYSMTSRVNPGKISEVREIGSRALISYLVSREVVNELTRSAAIDAEVGRLQSSNGGLTVLNWFQYQTTLADIKSLISEPNQ